MAASILATPTSFLVLPGEIRASIYKLLFHNYKITINSQRRLPRILPSTLTSASQIIWSDENGRYVIDSNIRGSSSAAILLTCHTILEEAISYLFASATLELTGYSAPDQPFATLLPSQYLQSLQLLLFPLSLDTCSKHLLARLEELPALRRVEMADPCSHWMGERTQSQKGLPSGDEVLATIMQESVALNHTRDDDGFVELLQTKRKYNIYLHTQVRFIETGHEFTYVGPGELSLFLNVIVDMDRKILLHYDSLQRPLSKEAWCPDPKQFPFTRLW